MLPFVELPDVLRRAATQLPPEIVLCDRSAGRTLRDDARAAWDLPRFDNSAMDGYAVRAIDTSGATPEAPVTLTVLGDIYAGDAADADVPPGSCRYITTGAVIPSGADAVIPIEQVERTDDGIRLTSAVEPGRHIRRRAEECSAGDTVLPAGTVLTAWSVAALQAAGVQEVTVARPARVALLATGSELVPPGTDPGPGQVIETNAGLLRRALPAAASVAWTVVDRITDHAETIRDAIAAAADSSDLIITTGGVSVGRKDLIKDVASDLGFDTLLWKVAQKPGKPVFLARRDDRLLVGLPGNPAAVGVAIPVMLWPLLRLMSGAASPFRRSLCRLSTAVRPEQTRTRLHWAGLGADGNATPLRRTGSHMLSDLGRADVLLIIPPGDQELPAGATVEAVALHT